MNRRAFHRAIVLQAFAVIFGFAVGMAIYTNIVRPILFPSKVAKP